MQQILWVRARRLRSEGSLNQHIKIKHPLVYKGMGFVGNDNLTVKESNEEDEDDDES